MAGTVPACRAVVAARRHVPDREAALLRALRVQHFAGELLDEPETIAGAARLAGIDAQALAGWTAEPESEALLREDMAVARRPAPEAVALSHKLARDGETGWRYTCPSYELSDGARLLAVPGFQPTASYEVAVANLAPEATRRDDPGDVREVLAWAGEPLATAEVAAVCDTSLEDAREQLGRVAEERHIGFDGLWSLPGA